MIRQNGLTLHFSIQSIYYRLIHLFTSLKQLLNPQKFFYQVLVANINQIINLTSWFWKVNWKKWTYHLTYFFCFVYKKILIFYNEVYCQMLGLALDKPLSFQLCLRFGLLVLLSQEFSQLKIKNVVKNFITNFIYPDPRF